MCTMEAGSRFRMRISLKHCIQMYGNETEAK